MSIIIFCDKYSASIESFTSNQTSNYFLLSKVNLFGMILYLCFRSSTTRSRDKSKLGEKCCRNFLTFSDPQMYKDQFPKGRKRPPPKQLCPITRYPARYVDPVTGIAFATKQAFKIVRETYAAEIEAAMSGETKPRKSKSSTSSNVESSWWMYLFCFVLKLLTQCKILNFLNEMLQYLAALKQCKLFRLN